MSRTQYLAVIAVVGVSVLLTGYWYFAGDGTQPGKRLENTPAAVPEKQAQRGSGANGLSSPEPAVEETGKPEDTLDSAVRPQFRDKPEVQKAWVGRGQGIVLNNQRDADEAEFRGTYFHRGFRDRAMTCGEVRFLAGGKVLSDYQRFIYVGVQSTHLEQDVPNFDALWDMLCVQTFNQ